MLLRIFVDNRNYFNHGTYHKILYLIYVELFGTVACAWQRQVRLGYASPQPSTRHEKTAQEKPNRKRGGAEPSPLNRLGDGCRLCRRA